jgi:hypothetical protein
MQTTHAFHQQTNAATRPAISSETRTLHIAGVPDMEVSKLAPFETVVTVAVVVVVVVVTGA